MDSIDDFMYDINIKYQSNYTKNNYNSERVNPDCDSNCTYVPLAVILCVVTFIYAAPCLLVLISRIFASFNNSNEESSEESEINRNVEIINLDYNRDYNRNNVNRGLPLPKYQCTSQLSEQDIYFTLPPGYSEGYSDGYNQGNFSESENNDSEVINILSDSDENSDSEVINIVSDSEN